MKLTIRKAKEKEFNEIAQLIKQEYIRKPYFEEWTIPNAIKTLEYYSKVGQIVVAELEGRIIGIIITRGEYYNTGAYLIIEELIVDSEFQGNGIGKKLVKEIEEHAKKNKIKSIILYASNKANAYGFYKKRGYVHHKHMSYFSKELKK